MAFNHRKILVPCPKNCNLSFFFPWVRTYPSPLPPPPPSQREPSLILPIWICVGSSIVLFIFLTIYLYLYITQPRSTTTSSATVTPSNTNRREDEEETEERDFSNFHHIWRIPTVGLHRSVINSITVVGYKKGVIDGTECSVCLNEFEENESLRLLPKCSHAFHINCIDTWFLSHKNCPLCRAPLVTLTKPTHQERETNHRPDSESSSGRQERSRSRNRNALPRAQSDLANHCGSRRRVENVRRSSSIGGSLSLCDVNIVARSGGQFYTSFSARFLSSSRRSRNQEEPILPN